MNPLAAAGLPRPDMSVAEASTLAQELFGRTGHITELGSQQDRNFRIQAAEGPSFLLKVANPEFTNDELLAQNEALRFLTAAGITVPQVVLGLSGESVYRYKDSGVRLLTFLDGSPLTSAGYLSPASATALGKLAGRTAAALSGLKSAGLTPSGLGRDQQWDLRNGVAVVERLQHHIQGQARRQQVLQATAHVAAALENLAGELRVQTIHGDITDDNVVAEPNRAGQAIACGVIDFGDLGYGWLVAELAVTLSCLLHHNPGEVGALIAAARAFDEQIRLTDTEIAALWPLVLLRGAVLEVSGEQQVAIDPTNAYAASGRDKEWMIFEQALALPFDLMRELFRSALGRPAECAPAPDGPVGARLLPAIKHAVPLDFSSTSPDLHGGRWRRSDSEAALVRDRIATATPASALLAPYGQFRMTRTEVDTSAEQATCALGTELFVPAGSAVHAPVGGTFTPTPDGAVLVCAGFSLILQGLECQLEAGTTVAAGELLGTVRSDRTVEYGRLWVQLSTVADLAPPQFATPDHAAGWLRLCPDPSQILGFRAAATSATGDDMLRRRQFHFAQVQEIYYQQPPQIERGWQHHLIDIRGRSYLDMMNNVTILGHGHPEIAAAAADQWQLLNTNSRFHYEVLGELCSQLSDLAPAGLDEVLLVNSGTEAVDLALRMAGAATGRSAVVTVKEAYHGWSMGSDAVSTSLADNPSALETRPEWVHLAAAPNTYRGIYRGPDSGPRYVADIARQLSELDSRGIAVAAFISESFYGNAGGVPLPREYLAGVYELIRARGGVCIADEVQVGFGRLGEYFWGFEEQRVVPDIITVAKSMGNGHPLGAVITTREIADAFRGEGSFFSSAGGSGLSCRIGLTVLQVLERENLQRNATEVGAHLKAELLHLMETHHIIGAVHGMGLYLGVELVRDRDTLEAAREETFAICERLRERGVIVQPTADRQNVLKIKPPLCLSMSSATFFVQQLDEVLTRGW
ncbi:aminotransferase [Nakamurella antarctica]|uniref:Aminotransferase n=1 Tax=Nakamurella antarctica TaxID=1902245 RepID=A0A3G8ZNE9_9ACTN|nr:aminotransferase [Nakamurella antarctica]AZI58780.1 aminotransferase [Nakamurella antarctica]